MSTRTALTVLDQGAYSEQGPSTKTFENLDTTNGNKIPVGPNTVCMLYNSSVSSRTITYSYDDDRGVARTNAVTLAAGEAIVAGPFAPGLMRHAGDAENGSHVWLTASGSAGDVKGRAVNLPPLR